jgi:hypothetical protein
LEEYKKFDDDNSEEQKEDMPEDVINTGKKRMTYGPLKIRKDLDKLV